MTEYPFPLITPEHLRLIFNRLMPKRRRLWYERNTKTTTRGSIRESFRFPALGVWTCMKGQAVVIIDSIFAEYGVKDGWTETLEASAVTVRSPRVVNEHPFSDFAAETTILEPSFKNCGGERYDSWECSHDLFAIDDEMEDDYALTEEDFTEPEEEEKTFDADLKLYAMPFMPPELFFWKERIHPHVTRSKGPRVVPVSYSDFLEGIK